MSKAPLPDNEAERLAALQAYEILDTAAEQQYDDLVELAAHICEAPIALISLIDDHRQWFKARHGLDARETERDIAFCAHAILQPETFVVEDALQDARFADNPLVTAEPKIRFYAGSPLVTPQGEALGTLCVIDSVPRKLSDDQYKALRILGQHVMGQLELRRRLLELRRLRRENAALSAAIDRRTPASELEALPSDQVRLRDAERARRALLSVLEDQKQIEEKLRRSEVRYRHLFERNPAPMLIYARGSLELLAVNEAFCQHYGFSRDQALQLLLTDLYPPAEKQRIVELAERLHGYANVGEWHHRRSDGSQITIVATSHDTQFDGREARIAVITDITERKRTEQALRDSEQRLRLALDAAHQGLYDLDLTTGEAVVSPEYARMLGYDPGDFHETHAAWRARLHPADAGRVRRIYDDYISGRIPEYRVECRQRMRDGDWKWILSLGKIQQRDVDGRPLRMLGTHTDINALKQAEQALHQLNEELEQRVTQRTRQLQDANRELETFTYSVSHDLKAPLRGIDGYSRLLLEDHLDQLDDEGRDFLRKVRHGVDQMNQLIEDLLSYSRMERRGMRSVPVDLQKLVNDTLSERTAELQAHAVQTVIDVDSIKVNADPEGLGMVLRNLIDNAVKFSRDSQQANIEIKGHRENDATLLQVCDNGIGFDMRFHDRIFEIFQRLQRAEEYEGTGIGLAIVRRAMHRMGGRVWAQSTPGQGACFFLELPG